MDLSEGRTHGVRLTIYTISTVFTLKDVFCLIVAIS